MGRHIKLKVLVQRCILAPECCTHHNDASDGSVLAVIGRWDSGADQDDNDLPCEPAGHGVIATESVESCKEFWRIFVRSSVVMDWIEKRYQLLWIVVPRASKEITRSFRPRAARVRFVGYRRNVGGTSSHIVATGREAYGGEPSGLGAQARNGEVSANGKHAIC